MQVQLDYETELTLALFSSRDQADQAVDQLRSHGTKGDMISERTLGSGIYQVADGTLGEEMSALWKGALIGVPLGVVGGVLLAVALGDGPITTLWIGLAGAANGAILGGFLGAIMRARFDDDVAPTLAVTEGEDLVLVAVETSGSPASETSRVRSDLKESGALGFLDPSVPQTERLLETHPIARAA